MFFQVVTRMSAEIIDIKITPSDEMEVLSQWEVNKLLDKSQTGLYKL